MKKSNLVTIFLAIFIFSSYALAKRFHDKNVTISKDLFVTGLSTLGNVTITGDLTTQGTIISPTITDFTNAGHDHEDATGGAILDHGLALTGLGDDDHTQYVLLLGRSGGQTLNGGTGTGENLTILSTSDPTTGIITLGQSVSILGAAAGNTVGIGVTDPAAELEIKGSGAKIRVSGTSGSDYGIEFESVGTKFWELISDPTDNSMSWVSTGAPIVDLLTTGEFAIGATSETHTTNAQFEVITTTQASIPNPIMTEVQRDAIGTPSAGMTIYNTTSNMLNFFNGSVWGNTGGGAGATIELDNLGVVAINSDLDPGTTNTRDLGNDSAHWKRLHVNTIQLVKTGTLHGFIDADTSIAIPSGKTVHVAITNSTITSEKGIAIHTLNTSSTAVDTGDVFFETGDQVVNTVVTRKSGDIETKTGDVTGPNNLGGSGGIKLETGTVVGSGPRGGITLDALTTEITNFGKYELTDLFGTSFGNQIPAFVIDGASAAAQNVFAGGIIYDGTGNESIFLIATKDIPAGAAEFSTDLSIQVGSDASTGGGVGALQLIVNQHTGPSGFGGNMLLRVHESINGTSGTLQLQTDAGVGFQISHGDSVGQVGEVLTTVGTTGQAEWASLKGRFRTTDPCGDTTNFPEATMFYNDTSDYYCFCTGAGVDVQMHSPATACF